jgi:hypothetical protein
MRQLIQKISFLFLVFGFLLTTNKLQAQQKTFNYSFELQGNAGTDKYVPFWLYSNQYGTIDLNSPSGNAIFNFHKNIVEDSGFDYGFGTTAVGRYSENEAIFFNQLYGTLAYGMFQLKAGRFYETVGTVDESLSMGSLATSSNATPMPKIKIGFPKYTDLPLTQGYVEFKGEIAHGWFEKDREIKNPWLHQKYAYLRLGGDFAFRPYIGLVHEVTWAGTGRQPFEGDLDDSFADFWRVFFAQSGDGNAASGEVVYKLGDHRGIWDLGFNLELANFDFKIYRHQIYNDKDGLKFQTPDALTGLSIDFPTENQQLVTDFVWEYMYTKDQGGPICPGNQRDGPGGCDNYYNNYLYRTGWTYEGRTIGNPLFLNAYNPQLGAVANFQRNPDNRFGIANNRIIAHHFGVEGHLSSVVKYKLLATWSRNYGTHYDDKLLEEENIETVFLNAPEQWSFLAKFSYRPFDPLELNASLAGDMGKLYEDRIGVMLGIKLLGTSSF